MSSDDSMRTGTAPRPFAGVGHFSRWNCMGCGQWRGSSLGSQGAGIRRRCAECVRTKDAQRAAA